jgi:hypothetical protein
MNGRSHIILVDPISPMVSRSRVRANPPKYRLHEPSPLLTVLGEAQGRR